MSDDEFMLRAIQLSREAVHSNGGPFGAVIVHRGRIVGEGVNRVVPAKDPTAHAELVAIRRACQTLGTHVLDNSTIYTSCEPCPMCLGAIWWARITEIVYGNTRGDAALIGFDDSLIYAEVASPVTSRRIPMRRLKATEALEAFELWQSKNDHVPY